MKKTIRGYILPQYIIDILTMGLCSSFIKMTILHENMTYVFSYDSEFYDEVRIGKLSAEEKIELILAVMKLCRECEEHLIAAENYLIDETTMLNRRGYALSYGLRYAFYPDVNRVPFEQKMIRMIDQCADCCGDREKEIFARLTDDISRGELLHAEMYLEKTLDRFARAS